MVARLAVNEGGACSLHYHAFKYNQFIIEEGSLQILVMGQGSYILNEGESFIVNPGLVHQFVALKPTRVWEIEMVDANTDHEVLESDIYRLEPADKFGGV